MKKYLFLLMLPLFMALASCGKEEPLSVKVESVSIAPSGDFSLKIGETKTLTASVKPADADDRSITWASSDASVATVSNGTVTAVDEGEAKISATSSNGKTASVTVTVTSDKPEPAVVIEFKDEKFKAALLAATGEYKIDTNDDGEITEEEAAKVKKINVSGMGITSIEEIKYFTALEELDASNNSLESTQTKSGTTLSFEQNVNIKHLNLSGNKLTTVDISTNVKLTNLNLSNNLLASLSVSTNVNLTQLKVNDNELTILDVSSNAKIEILDIRNNRLTTIDITANINITTISVGGQTTSTGASATITVTVTQEQADDDIVDDKDDDDVDVDTGDDNDTELDLSTDDKDVGAEAGSFTINVTANAAWKASNIPTWVKLTPSEGNGNAQVSITYEANPSTEEREAVITFTAGTGDDAEAETLTIEQAGKGEEPDPDTELDLSTDDKDVSAEAGSFNINVTSNAAWKASNIPTWVKLTPSEGNGNAQVSITYEANPSTEEREAVITFTAGTGDDAETETLAIEQAGKDNGGEPNPEDPDSGEGSLEDLEEEELQ